MCGILGLVVKEDSGYSCPLINKTFTQLFSLSESRGKEASGIVFCIGGELIDHKAVQSASKLVKTKEYKTCLENLKQNISASESNKAKKAAVLIGHTRLATNGSQNEERNNQPIIAENIAGVHNGIVVNSDILSELFSLPGNKGLSDSRFLFSLLSLFIKKGFSIEESARRLYQKIEGSASIAALLSAERKLLLATNTGSLYLCSNKDNNFYIFSSEKPILEKVIKKMKLESVIGKYNLRQLTAGAGMVIDTGSFEEKLFSLNLKFSNLAEKDYFSKAYFNQFLDKAPAFKKDSGLNLTRCSRCILPETIPFIKFDKKGVCNYCLSHKKIENKGRESLEEAILKHRRKDGRPDCVVALSGGRDSAYALHYVKRVLKMNPIAFTFDWGMVADIARRNQARLVGKLGVEHVVVSANIQRQRQFIRQNIKAWLKKPHLGMVVLFMAGDKPAEYYVSKVAKAYKINLVFLARGNQFENTDFKWGFLGLPRGEPQGVLHDLSIPGRIKFSLNSARHFISNPYYLNSALGETLFDYWTTYVVRYKFLYLWHYLRWDEAKIVSTLKKEYNWEVAKDTIQTWRIDDGTSPFYNFIYYTLAGFTENDAFRSNQVREGVLTREQALKLVNAENEPRYGAIKDYLKKVGLDCEEVITKIRAAPKLYNSI
jgi:asparagine synthetase B (glutamine-hydrolysing)